MTQSGQTRTFGYDARGLLLQAVNPESGTVNYAYDPVGNVTWRRDNRGIVTSYGYDGLNRLTQKTYTDGTPAVNYSYDQGGAAAHAIGQLTEIENVTSVTYLTNFDALGHVLSSVQACCGYDYNFAYSYNLAGGLTSETYPSGRTVTTGRDSLNRAFNTYGLLGGQQTNYVTATGYAPHGAVNTRWYGNTVVPAVGFNSRLQPDGIYVALNNSPNSYLWVKNFDWGTTGNNGTLLAASEEYNPAGPAPASALTWVYQGYGYDGVNRLNWIGDNGWNRSLNYDAYGNMWVQSNTGGPESGNTPVTNVFTGSTNRMATAGYDASGNQLSVGGNSVTYDAENRATATVEPGVGTEIYSYDGNGQRTWKGDPGSAVGYIYDAFGQLVAEHTTSTVVTGPSCQTCYLVYDQVGSPSLVTDQNGTVVARHDYLPFGEEVPANTAGRTAQWGPGNDNLPAKFTGQMRDAGTGMDYFGARYYSAALGRFTSPDPGNAGADLTNPQSWNGYGYVWNDPLDATDPSGLIAQANPPQQTDDNTDAFGPIGGWAWWWNVEWRTLTGTVPSYSSGGGGGGSSVATSVGVYGPQQTTPGSGLTMQVGMAVQTSPAIASPTKNGTKQPDLLNWTKLGSCLASSTANHYGLTASAGVSGLLALPIPKAIVPPYKVIGTTTTNILSIVGRYVDIDVPLTTIAGRTSGNLLRIAGRANPYVFAGLLAIDAGVIGSNTYNCYQQSGQTGGQHTANGSGAPQ